VPPLALPASLRWRRRRSAVLRPPLTHPTPHTSDPYTAPTHFYTTPPRRPRDDPALYELRDGHLAPRARAAQARRARLRPRDVLTIPPRPRRALARRAPARAGHPTVSPARQRSPPPCPVPDPQPLTRSPGLAGRGEIMHIVLFQFTTATPPKAMADVSAAFHTLRHTCRKANGKPYILAIDGGTNISPEKAGKGYDVSGVAFHLPGFFRVRNVVVVFTFLDAHICRCVICRPLLSECSGTNTDLPIRSTPTSSPSRTSPTGTTTSRTTSPTTPSRPRSATSCRTSSSSTLRAGNSSGRRLRAA
jgi:hypothetical protein